MHCPLPLSLPPPMDLQRQTSQVNKQHTPTRNWPGLMERRRKGTGGSAEATRSGNLREWQQFLAGQNPRNKRKKSQGKETLSVGSCLPTEIWGRILEERLEEREGETIFCRVATTSVFSDGRRGLRKSQEISSEKTNKQTKRPRKGTFLGCSG